MLKPSISTPMENLRNPKTHKFYLIFFIFPLQLSIFFDLSWAFSPADNYLLDCGSVVSSVVDNRNFVGDSSKSGSIFLSSARTISLRDQNPAQDSSLLYHTARVFTKPSNYEFKIKKKGTHLVRLHFFPFHSSRFNLSDARFHVSVHGFLLLRDFSGQETRNNQKNLVLKEYLIWVDCEKLVISFTPSKESSFAFVNAIEVFSAPEDLIADTAKFVNSEGVENIGGLTKQALETVYRVTVGGPKVTPFNDSLWRTWIPDDGFLKLIAASKKVHSSGQINYQIGGASREVAPDNVYNTARVMSNPKVSIPNFNITWIFPVSSGYRYLIRMHFCDISSMALNILYFNVYINGYSAYKDLDISVLTGQTLSAPYYSDFVVDADCSGVLIISIGPSSLSNPDRINAILNGLEIMKMNNSMGSLDGELSVHSVLQSTPRGKVGVLVPSVAVVCFLMLAFLIMHRRKALVMDSVGWSPLPVDAPKRKFEEC